jgi:endo-1,4-beta-mannosidase
MSSKLTHTASMSELEAVEKLRVFELDGSDCSHDQGECGQSEVKVLYTAYSMYKTSGLGFKFGASLSESNLSRADLKPDYHPAYL